MAFKLRSPLHTENPKFGEVPIASGDKSFGGYQSKLKSQMMSTKNPADSGVGTYPDPQTGKRTYYDKKHQSYSEKTGMVNKTGSFKDGKYIMNKPKPAAKPKSPYPSDQGGGSPFNIGQAAAQRDKSNAEYLLKKPAATPGKGSGVIPNLLPAALKPSNNIMLTNPGTNTKPKNTKPKETKPKNTKPTTNTSTNTSTSNTTNNTKPIKSSDSDKGTGYFNDKLSLGVDTKLNVAPMPKFERTVTNARSADYDMIRAKGRGKIDRLKTRLDKREGRVANRVEASSMRIKSRQQRSGNRYASKMEARTNTGTDPGYFDSQKKLDAFEKSIDSPKATSKTSGAGNILGAGKIGDSKSMPSLRTPKSNQTVAKPSMKLNTSVQTTGFIDDNKIKKGTKKASGGGKISADTYKSATGLNKLTKKAGPSGGMERGMTRVDQTKKLTNLASGNQPRKDVKNMSSKNYLTKGIKPSYKK